MATTHPEYSLDRSMFSFWQVITFCLVFGIVGSWVIRTFAAAPAIQSFSIAKQSVGSVDFSASTSKQPPDNLVVTNNCYTDSSALANSQTLPLSGWITNASVGHIGYVTFNNVPSKMRCIAYVHVSGDTKNLASLSYLSL